MKRIKNQPPPMVNVARRRGEAWRNDVAKYDVVVVGAGNAAFCAAQAAAEKGAKVLMVERAPKELMGGNSRFTAGAFRCVYDGVDDLKAIMPDLTKDEIDRSDFGTYTQDQFYDDMFRVTQYRTDGELCDRLVGRSRDAMRWLHGKGMKFDPIWGRQAYLIDGKFKFWGGLTVESKGGGPGLIDQHLKLAEKNGIEVRYDTRGISLIYDGKTVLGPAGEIQRQLRGHPLQVRGDRLRRLRIQRRDAHALSRPRLGAREGARHALQHRRRHQHGARHRRVELRQLVGLARGAVGLQRAGVRRPLGRRQLPEAQLSVGHPGQRHRAALRRRGRRLPQLHLCEIRRDRAAPAQQLRLAGVRRQDRADAARRVPHQARVEGLGQHASRSSRTSSKASIRWRSSTRSRSTTRR